MKHLLSISIGPVQDFIAAARKTSDLYAGSRMLTDLSKTVAAEIQKDGLLIFPANIEGDGPNKILIELNDSVDPAKAAGRAKAAANKYLSDQWVLHAGPYMKTIDIALAQNQIDSFIEFYAAWVPLRSESDYAQARCDLDLLLAGRKALRDFTAPVSRDGLAKSPLDPARDGVLLTGASDQAWRAMKLKPTESLDAVSLMKRLAGSAAVHAPSTSLLASLAVPTALNSEIAAELQKVAKQFGMGSDYSDLLYPERMSESEYSSDTIVVCADLRERALAAARLGRNESFPAYYAILHADGDRMGKLLAKLKTPDQHRSFSTALSGFADSVRGIVEDDYRGHLVYAGGDDVLALLPLNTAISCADRLRREFYTALRDHRGETTSGEVDGTLSVGIAIVHHLDALQTSLDHGRSAERFAKHRGGRNSLAVALHTRGGAPITVSYKWTDKPDPVSHMMGCIAAFRDRENGLSRGFPYELAAVAREWRGTELPENRLQAEAKRLLSKKTKSGLCVPIRDAIAKCADSDALLHLADTLIIARFLAKYPPSEVHP